MTVLVGLNILVSSFSSGRQFRAIAGTTHCLAACHSLVGSAPASCFRGHIFNFHLRLAACVKYFRGFTKYLQTDAWIHSFMALACAGCDNSLPFSGASSIPLCYVLFPASLLHQLPSSLTSSCHLFLGLSLKLVVSKFIYNTLLGIIFSSILCTCPNQCNLFNP